MACSQIVNRTIAAISLFLSLLSLSGCCWEFGSVMYRSEQDDMNKSETSMSPQALNETQNETENRVEFWTKFDKISGKFRLMIIISLWCSIVGLTIQFFSSAVIIFSKGSRVASRSKYWVAVHFITFVLLFATLFVPLTYNRRTDEFLKTFELNNQLKNGPDMSKGFAYFIWYDLHLYYIMLFVDICFLFISMIIVSCLLRLVDSNQEAFYAEIGNRYK